MGQMNAPLFELDKPSVQAEVNSYKPGLGLAWATLFPLKYTAKFDLKTIEGNDGLPISADRVAFNTRAPKKTRKKVGSFNLQLGKIAVSRDKDEMEINDYNDLKVIAAANTEDKAAAQELVNIVYDDVKFVNTAMDARVEIEALTIGSLGKRVFSTKLDGDMAESEEINFNIPETNFMGATAKWDNLTTADGIEDIKKGVKVVQKLGLPKPRYAIMEQKAFDLLCSQQKVIKKVASALVKAAGLDASGDVTLATINAYMATHGLPTILVIDSSVIVEGKDGSQEYVKAWNENSVVLSVEPRLGYTYWKPVPMVQNTDAVQVYGPYYKTTIYSDVNPMVETTMAEAYMQPGLTNRKSMVFINAMNTTWNDGE